MSKEPSEALVPRNAPNHNDKGMYRRVGVSAENQLIFNS